MAVGWYEVLFKLFPLSVLVDLYPRLAIDKFRIFGKIAPVGCIGRIPHSCLS